MNLFEDLTEAVIKGDLETAVAETQRVLDGGWAVNKILEEGLFAGSLAGKFVAVPNLINIVARQVFQGIGKTETEALEDCLSKIKNHDISELFPTTGSKPPETT